MNATTPASTATGPDATAAPHRRGERVEQVVDVAAVAALTDRWIVGGVPAYDICGWTNQPRAAISSQTVNASQLPSVTRVTRVESGATSERHPVDLAPRPRRWCRPRRTPRAASRS